MFFKDSVDKINEYGCVLSCGRSCSFCQYHRTSAKGRYKSRSIFERNKTCQRCFLCQSMPFCQSFSKCPPCCQRAGCRGQVTKFLAKVARVGCESEGSFHSEGGLCPTIQNEAPSQQVPSYQKWLCKPGKEPVSKRSFALIEKLVVEKVVVRTSLAFYNRLFLVPKPNKKWRPILDLSQLNVYLQPGTFKMEIPETIRVSLRKREWVTFLDFSDAYFHIPIHQRSRKYLRFFLNSKAYQFTALPSGLATAPLEFTKVVKKVKLMAQTRGISIHQYLDDWLLRAPVPRNLPTAYPDPLGPMQRVRMVNMTKSELAPQQDINFVGYRFNLLTGRVLLTQDRWLALQHKEQGNLHSQAVHVPHRSFDSDRKTGFVGSPPPEAHSVTSKVTLARPRDLRKDHSSSHVSSSPSGLVVRRGKHTLGATSTSSSVRPSDVYRCIKQRLGRSLKGLHCKRRVVRHRKSPPHKCSGAKGSFSGPKELRASLQGSDCVGGNRQHNCGTSTRREV